MALLNWNWPLTLALLTITVFLFFLYLWQAVCRNQKMKTAAGQIVHMGALFVARVIAFDVLLLVGSLVVFNVCSLTGKFLL